MEEKMNASHTSDRRRKKIDYERNSLAANEDLAIDLNDRTRDSLGVIPYE